MSFWQRLFGRGEKDTQQLESPSAEPVAAPQPESETSAPLTHLEALAADDGDGDGDAALMEFRAAAGGAFERAALDAVHAAVAVNRAPSALRVAAADVHVQRGEPESAVAVLKGDRSTAGLLLIADIRAERGDVAEALTLVETVIARELDAPGASERRMRLRRRLGSPMAGAPDDDAATILRSDTPKTDLRVVREAGRGGAGTVYEAFDDALDRRVAFKVYHRPKLDRAKLEREAALAVRFRGETTLRVYAVDPDQGWLVLEWIDGGALRGVIKRADQRLLLPIAKWFFPLCEAVHRVHEAGFVHADLKPGNVLMRTSGQPVLADFGICTPVGTAATGGSMGYLSPERLRGEPLDKSADVFALGRILEDALGVVADVLDESERRKWLSVVENATRTEGRPSDIRGLLALSDA